MHFAAETLQNARKPFFAGIFTLSSHNPFSVPHQYKGKFPQGTLPIHESIGYADFALRQFFDFAKKLDWFSNTLFVITGDHTSLSEKVIYNNPLGRFRVPIIFYDPSGLLPQIGKSKVAQHADITPSVLDLLGLTPEQPTLAGWSLFDPAYQGRFIQYEYGKWYFKDQDSLLRMDENDVVDSFAVEDVGLAAPSPPGPQVQNKVDILKGTRQYFSNGLLENSWHK